MVSNVAYAEEGFRIYNPIQAGTFEEVVLKIAQLLVKIGIPLASIFIVWAGFLFVTARGDPKQLETAKTTFYWTIIGAALVVGAYAIATAIVNFAKQL